MLEQIRQTCFQGFEVFFIEIFFRHSTVIFERSDSGYHDYCARSKPCHSAFNVQEFLRPKVCGKACLSYDVVGQLQRHAGCRHRIAAMGYVGERTSVNKCRRALKSLYEIRLQGVLEQCGHRALSLEVMSRYRLSVISISDYYPCQPLLEVDNVSRQTEYSHYFRRYGYVKAILARNSLRPAAKSVYYMSELSVVHIHSSLPGYLLRVYAQRVALLYVVIQHGGQQIVGGSYGVEIPGKMQVYIFHRNYLRVSASGGSALYAEYRPEGRLSQSCYNVLSYFAQSVSQSY